MQPSPQQGLSESTEHESVNVEHSLDQSRLFSAGPSGEYGGVCSRRNCVGTSAAPVPPLCRDQSKVQLPYMKKKCSGISEKDPLLLQRRRQEAANILGTNLNDASFEQIPYVRIADQVSWFQSLQYLIKANIGTAVFALPFAYYCGGMVFSPIGTVVIAVASMLSFNMLAETSTYFNFIYEGQLFDYAALAEVSMQQSSLWAVCKCAPFSKVIVNIMLIFAQFGNCTGYIIFTSGTAQTFLEKFAFFLDIRIYMIASFAFFLGCALIKDIKMVSKVSGFINVLYFACIFLVIGFLLTDLKDPSRLPQVGSWEGISLYFGNSIYCVEGIGCLIPLKNKTRNQKHFKYVLNFGMLFIFFILIVFGTLGYISFGDKVKMSISYNLPETGLFQAMHVVLVITILVTYTVQMYPLVQIILPKMTKVLPNSSLNVQETVLRVILSLLALIIALIVPQLALFLDLVGAVASSILALIMPPIMYDSMLYAKSERPDDCDDALDRPSFAYRSLCRFVAFVLVAFGVGAGTISAMVTVKDIVQTYK